MTMVQKSILVLAVLAWIGLASPVYAADVSAAYLTGTWALESAKNCGSDDSTYTIYGKSGSFEYGRHGRAEAVGFWSLQGEVVTIQTLTSPAYFADMNAGLKTFEGQYHYYTIVMMLVDQRKDNFTAVASLRDQISKFSAYRCK
jgi:hypothetical protein